MSASTGFVYGEFRWSTNSGTETPSPATVSVDRCRRFSPACPAERATTLDCHKSVGSLRPRKSCPDDSTWGYGRLAPRSPASRCSFRVASDGWDSAKPPNAFRWSNWTRSLPARTDVRLDWPLLRTRYWDSLRCSVWCRPSPVSESIPSWFSRPAQRGCRRRTTIRRYRRWETCSSAGIMSNWLLVE